MKKLLVLILLFSANLSAFSQAVPSFQIGLKAGGNFSKLSTNDLFNADNQLGYYGGLWFRIGAAGIHFQPEIYLTQKNTKLTNVATGLENKIKFTNVDVPLLIGTKIGAMGFGLRLNTGPVVSFVVNEEQDYKQTAAAIFSGNYKDQAIAWQFGAGLDIKKLGIDLRYEQGINKLNKTVNTDTKINLFTFGLAYRL